jgi:hypothetical protein
VHCNELYTSTQFCDKNNKTVCIEKIDGNLHISSNLDNDDCVAIVKVNLYDKKRFDSDQIIEISELHNDVPQKEVSSSKINSIIKNDKNVSKLRYIYF